MSERKIHKLPDGEPVIPFEDADNMIEADNPYKIDPKTPITTAEEI